MPAPFQSASDDIITELFAVIRRRWRPSLLVFSAVFGLVATMVLTARPVYRADAKLRIGEPPPSPGVSSGSSILGLMRMGGDPFANDLELLGSRSVTESVVRDGALTAKVTAPRGWHRDSLFAAFATQDSTITASYEARWLTADQIEIKQLSPKATTESNRATAQPVRRVAAGAPVELSGLNVVFRSRKRSGPELIQISTIPFGEAVRRSAGRIAITRTRRDANVVRIVYTDADPGIARTVTQSAVSRFVELRTRIQKREGGQNVDSLRAVARETLKELTRSEEALERLQRETRLVDPTVQSEAFVTRYSELGVAREMTRSHLRAIESVLARADSSATVGERWSKLLSYPAFRENEAIGSMLAQIHGLEQQRRQLSPRRTENNLEYRLILDQIDYMNRSLSALAADLVTTLSDELKEQDAQLVQMDTRLASMPRQAIELARRQRSTRVLSEVLVLTEQRVRQEELRQALSFGNVQVIDPPALRYKPVWPRKKLGLAVGFMLAGLSALLALVVSERADRRLRRAADVERITDAPVLGVAIRSKEGLRFTAQELGAVVQHASANGRGPLRIVIAPVGAARGQDLAAALRAALPEPLTYASDARHSGPSNGFSPEVVQAASLVDFASASAAASTQVPIALVVEAGRTTMNELVRAAKLVTQAGGRIGGTIVVCENPKRAAEVWA